MAFTFKFRSAEKSTTKHFPHIEFETFFEDHLDMKRYKKDAIEELQKFINYQEQLLKIDIWYFDRHNYTITLWLEEQLRFKLGIMQ